MMYQTFCTIQILFQMQILHCISTNKSLLSTKISISFKAVSSLLQCHENPISSSIYIVHQSCLVSKLSNKMSYLVHIIIILVTGGTKPVGVIYNTSGMGGNQVCIQYINFIQIFDFNPMQYKIKSCQKMTKNSFCYKSPISLVLHNISFSESISTKWHLSKFLNSVITLHHLEINTP